MPFFNLPGVLVDYIVLHMALSAVLCFDSVSHTTRVSVDVLKTVIERHTNDVMLPRHHHRNIWTFLNVQPTNASAMRRIICDMVTPWKTTMLVPLIKAIVEDDLQEFLKMLPRSLSILYEIYHNNNPHVYFFRCDSSDTTDYGLAFHSSTIDSIDNLPLHFDLSPPYIYLELNSDPVIPTSLMDIICLSNTGRAYGTWTPRHPFPKPTRIPTHVYGHDLTLYKGILLQMSMCKAETYLRETTTGHLNQLTVDKTPTTAAP